MNFWKWIAYIIGFWGIIVFLASLVAGMLKLSLLLVQAFIPSFAEGFFIDGLNVIIVLLISGLITYVCSEIVSIAERKELEDAWFGRRRK